MDEAGPVPVKAPDLTDIALARFVVGCIYAGGIVAALGFQPWIAFPMFALAAVLRAVDGWATHHATRPARSPRQRPVLTQHSLTAGYVLPESLPG